MSRHSARKPAGAGALALIAALVVALRFHTRTTPQANFVCGRRAPPPSHRTSLAATATAAPAAPAVQAEVNLKLYQFQSCPFCSKVRAYCDFHGVKIDKVEVNPVTKDQIKGLAKDYNKVPIADLNGEIITGSNNIVRAVAKELGEADGESDLEWGNWVDAILVKTLPPNIYRTPDEALQIAGKVAETGNFGFIESLVAKYFGAGAMYFVSKKMAEKAGIVEGAEREALFRAVNKVLDTLDDTGDFIGGDKPSMSDLEVFGVLASVEGTDTHEDMMRETEISDWYTRMKKACGRA